METPTKQKIWFITLVLLLISLLAITGYFKYQNNKLREEKINLQKEKVTLKIKLSSTTQNLINIQIKWNDLEKNLAQEVKKVSSVTSQIKNIAGTVDKINKNDPELLEKYSKIFFLNENYFPSNLTMINSKFTIKPRKDLWIKGEVFPFLEKMINDANKSGADLKILSAFRSFETQSQLKLNYTITYGSGANQFSADQGYSEHQLGTTLDFSTSETGEALSAFKNQPAYTWLLNNAYKYGFILSYPKNNSYYKFEPWHWRFVGKKLANYLHKNNLSFRETDQREINKYLLNIFEN